VGRIHESVPALIAGPRIAVSHSAVKEKQKLFPGFGTKNQAVETGGKLCAKNAPSFPQLPQPLLLLFH
jgi:hypothetical protein